MADFHHHLFKNLRPLGAPTGLKTAIISCIHMQERRVARFKLATFTPVLLISMAGLIWGSLSALSALSMSGFAQYVSLLFSDPTVVASAWFPYVFSLAESLPIFALTIATGAALALVVSSTIAGKSSRRASVFA